MFADASPRTKEAFDGLKDLDLKDLDAIAEHQFSRHPMPRAKSFHVSAHGHGHGHGLDYSASYGSLQIDHPHTLGLELGHTSHEQSHDDSHIHRTQSEYFHHANRESQHAHPPLPHPSALPPSAAPELPSFEDEVPHAAEMHRFSELQPHEFSALPHHLARSQSQPSLAGQYHREVHQHHLGRFDEHGHTAEFANVFQHSPPQPPPNNGH